MNPIAVPQKKHLTLKESAASSGRSYWQLRSQILSGELRAVQFKPGGKFYIRPDDLDALFANHVVSPLSGKVS